MKSRFLWTASQNSVANQVCGKNWRTNQMIPDFSWYEGSSFGGNSSHRDQERCDRLAVQSAREARQSTHGGMKPWTIHPLLLCPVRSIG